MINFLLYGNDNDLSNHQQKREEDDDDDDEVVDNNELDVEDESRGLMMMTIHDDHHDMNRMKIGNDGEVLLLPFQPSAEKGACIFLLICTLIVGIPLLFLVGHYRNNNNLPNYSCPSDASSSYLQSTENYNKDRFEEYEMGDNMLFGGGDNNNYVMEDKNDDNITTFLQTYRHREYDDWGLTFVEMKEALREFKETYFVPNIVEGSTIYESAMGIGLNLLLTMELLEENKPGITTTLTLYGNEFLPSSTERANILFQKKKKKKDTTTTRITKANKGIFCSADSTRLQHFVPSNSFDLVYTGYIQPILDPLHLNLPDYEENYDYYDAWCEEDAAAATNYEHNNNNNMATSTLARLQQEIQQDWYRKWVSEMIRIAKPGAPIIIESISLPTCENEEDFGGVNQQFWMDQVTTTTTDTDDLTSSSSSSSSWADLIEANSLEFAPDKAFPKRYHVFMRKRKQP